VLFTGLRSSLQAAWAWRPGVRAAGLSLLAAAVAAALLLLIAGVYWLARRRMGMGMGDVKLLAMLAAWLGMQQTALVLFLAVITGALYGLGAILSARRGVAAEEVPAGQLPIPFGTMLSVAGLYSIFLGERTVSWYAQFFR
jgi:leader peptidase (prepilin peptidase)/N-methyltransferase